jgi:hypothetical protein
MQPGERALSTYPDILLFCGFNIPTLLEVLSNRDLPRDDYNNY